MPAKRAKRAKGNPPPSPNTRTMFALRPDVGDMLRTLVADAKRVYGVASNRSVLERLIAAAYRGPRPFALTLWDDIPDQPVPDVSDPTAPPGSRKRRNVKGHSCHFGATVLGQLASLNADIRGDRRKGSLTLVLTELIRREYAKREQRRSSPT